AHLAKLNEVFQTKRMTLDLSIDALELTIASADVIRILEHLVFNAFYYSKPDGVIRVTLDADVKRLTVEDTGIGMSGETIARIHAGTHRGDDAMAYNQKGSGVGFQIVFEIAARIGAAVDIESVLGTGTKVHVWFDRHPR
ncbi:MAG: ATP-binding protein, partial [Bacillota bacterium]|nr:ATP-binding protein [Bacillota bacterium]